MIEFSISILAYNRCQLTRYCLNSVLSNSPRLAGVCEILVTDNGCSDQTPELLERLARRDPRLKVIRHQKNLGVIKAKNIALRRASGRYFVSLDNDCSVDRRWLQYLREPMLGDPRIAQVGRSGGYGTLTRTGVGVRGKKLDYIDGSCFLTVTEIARKFGLCDEAYKFAYCEDSDYSLRLRKAGWKIARAPAPVRHAEHKTAHGTGLNLKPFWKRNHALFIKRWGGYLKDGKFGHPGEPSGPTNDGG